jgi:hypothetical protein
MAFWQMCDCLELLRDGMIRGDAHLLMPATEKFVHTSAVAIFKKSRSKHDSFRTGKIGLKVKDWITGATRYGNGTTTNNISATAGALRMRNLIESMQGDAPEALPHSNMSSDALVKIFCGTPPPAAQQAGTQPLFSPIHNADFGMENIVTVCPERAAAAAPSSEDNDAHRLTAVPEPTRPSMTAALGNDVLGGDDGSYAVEKAFGAACVVAFVAGDAAAGAIRLAKQWGPAKFRSNAKQPAGQEPPARESWGPPRRPSGTRNASGQ